MADKQLPASHAIPLAEAVKMTRVYRKNRQKILSDEFKRRDILPLAETFNKEAFRSYLDNDNCKGIRIYLGMKEDMTIHSVIVGVDAENRDMLPSNSIMSAQTLSGTETGTIGETTEEDLLIEKSIRCPPDCPPPSDLNIDPIPEDPIP